MRLLWRDVLSDMSLSVPPFTTILNGLVPTEVDGTAAKENVPAFLLATFSPSITLENTSLPSLMPATVSDVTFSVPRFAKLPLNVYSFPGEV